MRSWNRSLLCAICCGSVLVLAGVSSAQTRNQTSSQTAAPEMSSSRDLAAGSTAIAKAEASKEAATLPDSPGTEWAKTQESTAPLQSGSAPNAQQTEPSGQDQKQHRPVGTAAAEAPTVSGITAAEPAGVAIAPAKQHRARALVIKVGAIAGAGVALGTVVALSTATHSKPPGAH